MTKLSLTEFLAAYETKFFSQKYLDLFFEQLEFITKHNSGERFMIFAFLKTESGVIQGKNVVSDGEYFYV